MKMLRPALGWLVAAAVLVVVGYLLRDRLPSAADVLASLHLADTGWLLVAAMAEMISMGMFARQQRRLLIAFGGTISRLRSLALAYSRSAISISLPAGSAVSAAYAFRQFRFGGASRRAASTVMVLSGLLSFIALALLYVTGLLAEGAMRLAGALHARPAVIELAVGVAAAVALLVAFLAWPAPRTFEDTDDTADTAAADGSDTTLEPAEPATASGRLSARTPLLAKVIRPLAEAIRSSRSVAGRHWFLALASATANWLTDLLCLAAAARAFDLPLSMAQLGTIYLTVQIVRQIPLTPGGIGVIEVSLLAGMISAGAADAPAAATVLVYRLLSCWLILPAGLVGWLVLRRPVRSDSSHPAEPALSRLDTPHAPRREPLAHPSTAAHA